jgi:superfamily II DNA or RNA helicase
MAANVNTIIQTIGRIHRLGQERVEDIYIITVDHSYDQILHSKAAKKMVAQLAGESRHERTAEENQASAGDLVTRILGQRCSRVGWADTDLRAKDQLKQAPFQLQGEVLERRATKSRTAKTQGEARTNHYSILAVSQFPVVILPSLTIEARGV